MHVLTHFATLGDDLDRRGMAEAVASDYKQGRI